MARQRVLGLPIGKKKKPSHQVAKTAGVAAAVLTPVVAIPVGRKVARKAGKATQSVGRAGEGVGKTGEGVGNAIRKTREASGQLSNVLDTASDVKESMSGHSSKLGKIGGAVKAVAGHSSDGDGGGGPPKLSHVIEEHTDIAAPRSVVYNQWTQFEMFPTLVKGIESVEQEGDEKATWTAKIGPSRRKWTGKITEQVPDERIAWESEGGVKLKGVVTFHSLDVDLTRVLLQMEYSPSGAVEWVGNTLRVQRRRARRDLRQFKHFIELRGEETGAWRGRIGDESEDGKADDSGNGSRSSGEREQSRPRARAAAAGRATKQASSRVGSGSGSGSRPSGGPRQSGGARPGGGSGSPSSRRPRPSGDRDRQAPRRRRESGA